MVPTGDSSGMATKLAVTSYGGKFSVRKLMDCDACMRVSPLASDTKKLAHV